MIYIGCAREVLKDLPPDSVDAIVTDPPYGLAFMGKKWDYDVPSVELWREVLRVLKPGAHLLSFGGTRTYHRMVVNIEDAGFEIRDQVMWIYGSGFPKSLNIDKAIDKAAGAKRDMIPNPKAKQQTSQVAGKGLSGAKAALNFIAPHPATDAAKQWAGWGTALKPANEPIVLARKPIEKGLTVAENVLKYGTGAINIDGTRIGMRDAQTYTAPDITGDAYNSDVSKRERKVVSVPAQGRWPANVLFDEDAAAALDEQSGHSKSQVRKISATEDTAIKNQIYGKGYVRQEGGVNDSGGASRFFYVAKASKRERGADNGHPTVKPIKLMEYLCRLITPPDGVILDPFMGSGSTGLAAKNLGLEFIGIEREQEYFEIAKRRLEALGTERAT